MAVNVIGRLVWPSQNQADAAGEGQDAALAPAAKLANGAARFAAGGAMVLAGLPPGAAAQLDGNAAASAAAKLEAVEAAANGARQGNGSDERNVVRAMAALAMAENYGALIGEPLKAACAAGEASAADVIMALIDLLKARIAGGCSASQALADSAMLQRIFERIAKLIDAMPPIVRAAPPEEVRMQPVSLPDFLARREVAPGPETVLSKSLAREFEQILKSKRKISNGLRVPDLMAAASSGGFLNVANLGMLAPVPADETSREAETVRSSHLNSLRSNAFPRGVWPDMIFFDAADLASSGGASAAAAIALTSVAEGLMLRPVAAALVSLSSERETVVAKVKALCGNAEIVANMHSNVHWCELGVQRGVIRVYQGRLLISSDGTPGGPIGQAALMAAFMRTRCPTGPCRSRTRSWWQSCTCSACSRPMTRACASRTASTAPSTTSSARACSASSRHSRLTMPRAWACRSTRSSPSPSRRTSRR